MLPPASFLVVSQLGPSIIVADVDAPSFELMPFGGLAEILALSFRFFTDDMMIMFLWSPQWLLVLTKISFFSSARKSLSLNFVIEWRLLIGCAKVYQNLKIISVPYIPSSPSAGT
jgi:hypothetical protein